MNPLAGYLAYRRLQQSQWLDRTALRRLQERKLRLLLEHAYHTVPYYRRRFAEARLVPEDIRSLDDLGKIPITSKAELQAADPQEIMISSFFRDTLISERTSGSTGRPFTMRFEPHFVRVRNGLFLRALTTAGYDFGRRLMLVTSTREKPSRRWLGWHYVSIEDPPQRLLSELNRFRPWVLYGCVTPLRQLALAMREAGAPPHRPRVVVSTAETLDAATRRLFEEAYQAEVYDAYGLTEMGIVAWECAQHDGYHLAEDTTITEFVPGRAGASSSLVMTNLELKAMPLIRFQTADLGVAGEAERCACGRALARLNRVEGRSVDCVRLPDGRSVSPYRLTLAIEQIQGIGRYQVVQDDLSAFTLRLEVQGSALGMVGEAARQAIVNIVGQHARVRVQAEANLDPPLGRKFRVVESRLVPGRSV